MNCKNFGRGRGFGPRGTRGSFRPRFPGPPFRHVGPPRPGRPPAPFGMPWQPNRFFQPHMLRGNPQFRPGGRKKRFFSYDVRFPAPNTLPPCLECEEAPYEVPPYWDNSQAKNNQAEAAPQLPLLGSEEERQQKITETADRLKQKLSCISKNEMINIWPNDVSNNTEDNSAENINIPVHRYEPSELILTNSDLKDIGKVNSDNLKCNSTQHLTDVINVVNNINRDVMLDENNDGSQVEITFDGNQMTNLVNVQITEYMDEGEQHELVDTSHNLEQSNIHQDIDIENELLESNVQCSNIPLANTSQDQWEQQQDVSQETSLPIDSTIQETLHDCQEEPFMNSEVEKDIVYDNCTSLQPTSINVPVLNDAADNQSPRKQEGSLRSGPPELSPHIEQELPVDFDPTTPPPLLLKQDSSYALPPLPDLPLFNPAEPPPNMRHFEPNVPHENANSTWSNVQSPMPIAYNNMEVHTELNMHGGFAPQQLPLEVPSQSNIFMPPHIETINFSPLYSVPPSNNASINTNISPMLPQMQMMPPKTFVPLSSSPEPPISDLQQEFTTDCNKDDMLNDMQEAMKFAKEMTEIVEKDENSASNSLSESSALINPISDITSIALPPGKPIITSNKSQKYKKNKKRRDYNQQLTFAKQSTSSHPPPEDAAAQDANAKSKQASLMNEQDRPKVVFNLNNKTKVLNVEWEYDISETRGEKRNGMMQSDTKKSPSSVIRKNLENKSTRSKEEERNLRKSESNLENATLTESIGNQDTMPSHKKAPKDAEKSPSVIPFSKVSLQKSKRDPNRVEKGESSNSEASWKNKIINRFLKMSKNDIYNMVNNTSLRKFDIIMKRLVKEKKSTLSLEMRHAQDEKMKLYDQQEFMKQLNDMLDSDTIESVTDLPTEFIHHLNEVLQLDMQFDNYYDESAVASSSHSEPALRTVAECTTSRTATPSGVDQESARGKSHDKNATHGGAIKTRYDKDAQAHGARSNEPNLTDDIFSTVPCNNTPDKLLITTLQHDVDNIFSEVTKKIQVPAAAKERKHFGAPQRSAKKLDDGAAQRNVQKEPFLEDDRTRRWEIGAHWLENRWKRKEREDPRAYRNLTKEEWEAKYGTQASSTTVSALSVAKKAGNKNILKRVRGRKILPRRRHSSESSKQPNARRSRTLEKDKHKESRRHSDDRRHTAGYTEVVTRLVRENSNDSSSSSNSSSTSSSSSSSTSSSSSRESNVTKLLREIKEKEKVAKQMSLNETIRDEVNAEIERERERKQRSKSRRNRKNSKNRKEKRTHHKKKKKKKQSKKLSSSSESSSDKDSDDGTSEKLLTENEIKKENEVTQQVIIKEELDIGQEEIVANPELANVSARAAVNLPLEPRDTSKSPSSSSQETTTVGSAQLHTDDRMPAASPTQPKTKAQLKQMPETADMNDNKVPLNVFTSLPKDWNTINPAVISACIENKSCEVSDVNNDKIEISPPAIDDSASSTADGGANVSRGESTETIVSPQLNTLIEPSSTINTQDDNETPVSVDVSNKVSTVSATSALASVSAAANTSTQKQGSSKKIDIKTYYERTIRRRMNGQGELKKPAESSPAAPAEDLPTKDLPAKIAKREITIDKSIRDPRLISQAKSAGKNNVAQTTSGKDARQEDKQTTKESRTEIAALKRPKKDSNRTINIADGVKKIDHRIEDTSANAISNIATTSSKVEKNLSIEKSTSKKLQSKISTDSKRFKNIRSEGSKELKLKKETTRKQRAKKKSAIAPKSTSLVSPKVYYPLKEPATTESAERIVREKSADNINSSELDTERTVHSTTPREDKIDSNAEIKPSTVSLKNADNDKLPHDKSKEHSSKSDFVKEADIEEDAITIESADARLSSETTRSVEYANDATSIANTEDENADEISNVAPELDAPIVSTTISEISNDIEKVSEAVFSNEIQQSVATEDVDRALDHATQITKIKEDLLEGANNSIPIEEHGVSDIPKLDLSQLDGIDAQGKRDQLLISACIVSNLEINGTKENNMKADASDDTYRHASEGDPRLKKTAEMSTVSNESSLEQQGNGVVSPDSVGSPFKGFLQETAMDFEQPNLFSFELNDVDDGKKPIDHCSVNCMTDKEMQIGRQQNSGMLEPVDDYANMNISGDFNITFDVTLLASDKECATSERSDKCSLTAVGEECAEKSLSEIVTTALHEDDNDVNTSIETEKQLISEDRYASNTELAIKESMFINEEEMIQDETHIKDLTDKLKSTADPSLTDAIDATISDDALRPEGQGVEQLNNHMYLETHVSSEKTPCDKLPDFDEHLDNMFYLDDRLQSTAAFDNKDDASAHFSVHQESPPYDITPAVTPETTMITACGADLSHEKAEQCEFSFNHISSVNNDILAGDTPVECSPIVTDMPRTLNVPTKAALKEAATNLFLKSPNSAATASEVPALGILEKTPHSGTDLNYQTLWHVNTPANLKMQSDTSIVRDFVNINTSSRESDKQARSDLSISQNRSATPSRHIDDRFSNNMQCNVVLELKNIEESDGTMEKKTQKSPEKMRDSIYKARKKQKDRMLHNFKDKRRMKGRSRDANNLTKKLKNLKPPGKQSTRNDILARMLEIDIEIHKLMTEKLELHEKLQCFSPTENLAPKSSALSSIMEDNKVTIPSQSTLLSLTHNTTDENHAKRDKHPPKSLIKRKRTVSHTSEDDEIVRYTPKKMPVIKWKKTPRLEINRREEEEEKEEDDLNERAEQQTSKTSASKKADGTPNKIATRKSESDRDTRAQEVAAKTIGVDKSSKRAISSDKDADSSKRQNSTEREAERAERFSLDKKNNASAPSEATKANSQALSGQVHNTPEPLSIYSDDSTWDSLVQNTASEMHENRKATGLALLDEKLKQQQAKTRKLTAIMRKKNKRQLSNYLKSVNNLTVDEEDLPLSKLYIRKLRQQRDLLDTLSQKKRDASLAIKPNVLKNMDEVINAVAENRVENLYEPPSEAQTPTDVPTTSNVLQADKFYVDVEANANSDWPCREKEDMEAATDLQQDSNDTPGADGSNHVFKAVNQDKTFLKERNVEPDSSVTPEETLIESHSSDYAQPKDPNDALRSFDIKVSVPKILIKNDFSLGLLQKLKDKESDAFAGAALIDSTTNALSTHVEKLEEKDQNAQSVPQLEPTEKEIDLAEEDKREEESEKLVEKDEYVTKEATGDKGDTCELQELEKTDSVRDAQSVPQLETAKSGYSDAIENEDTRDSVASNKIVTDTARDTDTVAKKTDTTEKRSDVEPEQLSNDAATSRQDDDRNAKNSAVQMEPKTSTEVVPHVFEKLLDSEQNTGSSVLPNEKSEESNEMSIGQRSDSEHTSMSVFPFNRVADLRKGETGKRSRRRYDASTPVRRSTRYSNENMKPKINDVDSNSNSSEQDSIIHEREHSSGSKSPSWAMRDERNLNNVRKNRAAQKEQSTRKVLTNAEPETNVEDSIKSNVTAIAEPAASKSNTPVIGKKRKQHTEWQIRNCKVRLIDCKYTYLKRNVDPEVLSKFGIAVINPPVSSNISYMQRSVWDQDIAINSAAVSKKSFLHAETSCDKDKSENEATEAKTIEESNNDADIAQEVSDATKIDDEQRTQYTVHKGPILDIKIFENSFLAASEDGKIYRYSQTSNGILNIYKGHKSAVTCLYIYKSDVAGTKTELMYSGSLDGTLRCYNITTGVLVKNPANINSPIQCMDQAWGIIFVGTKSGHVSRFHIKPGVIKGNSIEFSEKSVLALKATNEGPRRILIVASRNLPITIRDAQTGLFLRTISSQKNHTVYSLMRHHNLIYCGTSSTLINVFDFTTGEQTIQYDAGVGIVCMRFYEHLLFAGCYDGNIYVFDTRNHKLVCSIPGPGNMLLSIEVVHNKIIAGSKDKRLHSWQMPIQVRALL